MNSKLSRNKILKIINVEFRKSSIVLINIDMINEFVILDDNLCIE